MRPLTRGLALLAASLAKSSQGRVGITSVSRPNFVVKIQIVSSHRGTCYLLQDVTSRHARCAPTAEYRFSCLIGRYNGHYANRTSLATVVSDIGCYQSHWCVYSKAIPFMSVNHWLLARQLVAVNMSACSPATPSSSSMSPRGDDKR